MTHACETPVGSGPSVLVVDDDREFADLMCRRLLKSGYRVTELHHPRRALGAACLI